MSRRDGHEAARSEPRDVAPYGRGVFHAARDEKSRFRLNVERSLELHWRLACAIAIMGVALTTAYLVKYWPVYSAEALVAIQPISAAGGVAENRQGSGYDATASESLIQQQIASMTRADVLTGALKKLTDFQHPGESDADAARRLSGQVHAERRKDGFEAAIESHAGNAQMAADIANAVAQSYIENTARQQQAADAARLTVLRQEADRVNQQIDDDRAQLAIQNANSGVTTAPQSTDELNSEVARLENRYSQLDDELENVLVEDAAPGTAHVEMPAVAPVQPVPDGVGRNAALLLAMFLLLALLATVAVNKMDPRLYVASDVEQVVGFPPVAQLPDTDDVSDAVFEKYLLRLAAAVDEGLRHSGHRSCVFTGTSTGTGVTTVATQVRALMEGLRHPAVLVDTTGNGEVIWPGDESDHRELSEAQPLALAQRLADEARATSGTVMMADAAPIVDAAETEVLVRSTDCVIVVIESGVTTRGQLRATACVLQRLDVGAVGFVLNRVKLAKSDRAFRNSVTGVERHVRMQRRTRPSEPVRTRRVEAEPARAYREPPKPVEEAVEEKFETVSTAEPRRTTPIGVPIARGSAPNAAGARVESKAVETPGTVGIQQSVREQRPVARIETRDAGAAAENAGEVPWWLADPVLRPEMPAPRPRAQGSREARLSDLRNLFRGKLNEPANPTPSPEPTLTADEAQEAALDVEAEEEILLGPEYEVPAQSLEERARRATPEVIAVPEYLPPKPQEAKQEEDSTSRRERRDTWDNLAILPSWRGQYRRKE